MKIVINGKEYAWGDVQVVMWGRNVVGLRGIDYKTKKDKQPLYAMGRTAKSIQHGKRSVEGTITLTQSEFIAMNRAAQQKGYKDLLDVEVDIIVSYIPEDSVAITMDRIVCASFSELPAGMKEGDLNAEHAMPFVALDCDYNLSKV